jgi:predicted DNA repair protein MutK
MSSGLLALLDDVAAIAKLSAASLDDVAAQTLKAGAKAAGVVIDDTAVTPAYVTGLSPKRELPIIGRIALGSLRNKLLILLPASLVLSEFAPWAIPPLLLVGGLYLCFEGAEKLDEAISQREHGTDAVTQGSPKEIERARINGAIQTDLILSAEIMVIALNTLTAPSLVERALALTAVAVAITAAVYGVVAMIVKADDVGVSLARPGRAGWVRAIGRGLVTGTPKLLSALAALGTAAMLWVGGGIVLHSAGQLGLHAPEDVVGHAAHGVAAIAVPALEGAVEWLAHAVLAGLIGAVLGWAIVLGLRVVRPGAH